MEERSGKVREMQERAGGVREKVAESVEERKELWREETLLQQNVTHAQNELRSAERSLASMTDKDTGSGLQAVERIQNRLKGEMDGVYGPLYKLFEIPSVAVELTAGNSLFHVVVDNDTTVQRVLDVKLKEKTGRVTFMPLQTSQAQAADAPAWWRRGTVNREAYTDPATLGSSAQGSQVSPAASQEGALDDEVPVLQTSIPGVTSRSFTDTARTGSRGRQSSALAYTLFEGPTSDPPPALTALAALGDLYLPSVRPALPAGARAGNVVHQRLGNTWRSVTTSLEDTRSASKAAHPTSKEFSIRFAPGDDWPVYVARNTLNKALGRLRKAMEEQDISQEGSAPAIAAPQPRLRRRKTKEPDVATPMDDMSPLSALSPLPALSPELSPPPGPSLEPPSFRGTEHLRGAGFAEDCLLAELRGTDVKICLPSMPRAVRAIAETDKKIMSNYVEMIEDIKKMLGAQPAALDPQFHDIQYSRDPTLMDRIEEWISNGDVVVLRQAVDDIPIPWGSSYMDDARLPNDRVTPHSLWNKICDQPIAEDCTFRHFVDSADDPDVCLNLLDCPSGGWREPWYIRRVAEHRAYESTLQIGLQHPGIENVATDMFWPLSWLIFAHAGYFTFFHHDSNGFGTWLKLVCGTKIWSWLRPQPLQRGEQLSYQGVQDRLSAAMLREPAGTEMFTAVLHAGDVIIQPPGLVHCVYTADKSFAAGGHFYSYNSLHLSEMAEALDAQKGDYYTNEEHPAVPRLLARMALCVGKGPRGSRPALSKRGLLAMFRLICLRPSYAAKVQDPEDVVRLSRKRSYVTWVEHRQDFILAEAVLRLLARRFAWDTDLKKQDIPDRPWDAAGEPHEPLPLLPLNLITQSVRTWWFREYAQGRELTSIEDDQLEALFWEVFPDGVNAVDDIAAVSHLPVDDEAASDDDASRTRASGTVSHAPPPKRKNASRGGEKNAKKKKIV